MASAPAFLSSTSLMGFPTANPNRSFQIDWTHAAPGFALSSSHRRALNVAGRSAHSFSTPDAEAILIGRGSRSMLTYPLTAALDEDADWAEAFRSVSRAPIYYWESE